MCLFCGCKCVYFVDASAFILWMQVRLFCGCLFAFGMFLMLRFSNFQKHKQAKTKTGFLKVLVLVWCFGGALVLVVVLWNKNKIRGGMISFCELWWGGSIRVSPHITHDFSLTIFNFSNHP